MSLNLSVTSALNLNLSGSVGSFSVGTGLENQKTVEVKYFLTHVGLNFSSPSNEEVLRHLAPVREIFPTKELEFDEIMQRDIDDARVSSELVPYLLDRKSRDLVKLFPPIIVVVLPIKEMDNKPADYYPVVEGETRPGSDHDLEILRSGPIGREVFQFEQPVQNGVRFEHDLCKLKINTNRSKLVIVDGQHRAMALLALYRNLKQDWSDSMRAPYKDYYEEWTPNYIRQFELANVSLPVMFCTFPTLDENYGDGYNVKMAARSIFLTLNKTARQVSASRNRLLDDNDLVALFLRDTLSTVKKKDNRSEKSLRIVNVELDQASDRVRIDSPVAMTGVNHIYYLIEHLLFNRRDEDVNGAKPRSGKFAKRTELSALWVPERLDGRNEIGDDVANSINRNFYAPDVGEKLAALFRARFGKFIVQTFEDFEPYEAHASAVLWLEQQINAQANTKLAPILFEGQGIGRTFAAHQENLADKLRSGEFGAEATKIQEISDRLRNTQKLVSDSVASLRKERATRYLNHIGDKKTLRDPAGNFATKVTDFANDLYDNVFTTVAFQTAVIATFFGEVERCTQRNRAADAPLDVAIEFSRYLTELNAFFSPKRSSDLKRLVELFAGSPDGDLADWNIRPSQTVFRKVVYRGEMQPDQWPKYKYLILEIWRGQDSALASNISSERSKCRHQVFNSLVEDVMKETAEAANKRVDDLTPDEIKGVIAKAYETYREFIRKLGWNASEVPTKATLLSTPEDASATAVTDETWGSAPDEEPIT
jgi:hypothetical protein